MNAPGEIALPGAVWTGSQMIVWGEGWPNGVGGMFDPAANGWTRWLSVTGGPGSRYYKTVVWAGSRMIVWGGIDFTAPNPWNIPTAPSLYDPASDTWTSGSTAGAPEGRWFHTAISTGSKTIVWGGQLGSNNAASNTGGIYDPATNTWVLTSMTNAPSAREYPVSVWTGTKMIVWGSADDSSGGVFDPATNTWKPTSTVGAPSPRGATTAVWTGTKMIVWGGLWSNADPPLNTGGQYDPATDTWTPTSLVGAPSPRYQHSAVWTGTRMVVWGGAVNPSGATLNSGGIYDPVHDTWSEITAPGAPSPRLDHAAIWTGSRMLIWGGHSSNGADGGQDLATGGIYYDPALVR